MSVQDYKHNNILIHVLIRYLVERSPFQATWGKYVAHMHVHVAHMSVHVHVAAPAQLPVLSVSTRGDMLRHACDSLYMDVHVGPPHCDHQDCSTQDTGPYYRELLTYSTVSCI